MSEHYIHRGLAKKSFKENTLSAFKYSFEKKYGIETDLHVTKDNQLICFHDFNLKRKFNLNKKVKDVYYSDIKKISIKNHARVPLLKELLKISKNKHFLLLEIKPFLKDKNLQDLATLLKKVKKYKIISFKEKNLVKMYQLNKKIPLGLLMLSNTNLKEIKAKSKLKHVKFIVLDKKFLIKKKLKKIKKPIYFYTIRSKKLFNKYRNSKNLIFENL